MAFAGAAVRSSCTAPWCIKDQCAVNKRCQPGSALTEDCQLVGVEQSFCRGRPLPGRAAPSLKRGCTRFQCTATQRRHDEPPSQQHQEDTSMVTRRGAVFAAAVPCFALPALQAQGVEAPKGGGAQGGGLSGALGRYIKRKKLEPLDSYVSQILLCDSQLEKLGESLAADAPDYQALRSRLRQGAFASFRTDLRAVSQYASENGWGKDVPAIADNSLTSLENIDSLLFSAIRSSSEKVDKAALRESVESCRRDIDKLVENLPAADLAEAQKIVSSYLAPSADALSKTSVEPQDKASDGDRPKEDSQESLVKRGKGDSVKLEDLL